MPNKNFVITETISEGWNLMKANLKPLIVIQLAGWLFFGLLLSGGLLLAAQEKPVAQLAGNAIQVIVQLIFSLAMMYIALKVLDHHKPEMMDWITPVKYLPTFVLSTLLYIIVVLVGLIMFVVPGLIFAVRFGLYGYYVIDKGAGPVRALEQSWDTVKGASWRVFFMGLLCQLINLAGFLCLIFGLLFTMPAMAIALAAMYRKLSKQTFELQDSSP